MYCVLYTTASPEPVSAYAGRRCLCGIVISSGVPADGPTQSIWADDSGFSELDDRQFSGLPPPAPPPPPPHTSLIHTDRQSSGLFSCLVPPRPASSRSAPPPVLPGSFSAPAVMALLSCHGPALLSALLSFSAPAVMALLSCRCPYPRPCPNPSLSLPLPPSLVPVPCHCSHLPLLFNCSCSSCALSLSCPVRALASWSLTLSLSLSMSLPLPLAFPCICVPNAPVPVAFLRLPVITRVIVYFLTAAGRLRCSSLYFTCLL